MTNSRTVFLDTEVFVGTNFNFGSPRLQRLAELSKSDRLSFVFPKITIFEVHKKISDSVKEAIGKIGKSRNDLRIFRNLNDANWSALFDPIDEQQVVGIIHQAFDDYVNSLSGKILPLPNDAMDEVVRKYFDTIPPFQSGRKKSEFPDAIAVEALLAWSQENGNVTMVSADSGFKDFAKSDDKFEYFPSVSALLHALDKEDKQREYEEFVSDVISLFEDDIKGQFKSRSFSSDLNGDVELLSIDDIAYLDISVQDFDQDEILFSVQGYIDFTVDMYYEDYGRSLYYGGRHVEYISGASKSIDFDAYGTLQAVDGSFDTFDFSIDLDLPSDIVLEVFDEPDYP